LYKLKAKAMLIPLIHSFTAALLPCHNLPSYS